MERTGTKKSSAYDPNFEQHLIDHGVYPIDYDFPDDREPPRPNNEEEILNRLTQPRPSLSSSHFSHKAFCTFKRTNSRALTETMVMRKPFPTISGDNGIPSAAELPFGNLEPLTDGTIVDAKPDFYDGANPAQIDRRIREELNSHIIPSNKQHAPALPNFFTEGKGPDGSAAVATRQACYDGALGARAMHSLQMYGVENSKERYDNNAYIITSTYHNGNLKMYTAHPGPSENPSLSTEYHMTQVGGWDLTGSSEQFRQGAGALRNARDWAKEKRDELIAVANGRVDIQVEMLSLKSSAHTILSSLTNEPALVESETSADEPALIGRSEGLNLSRKRPRRASKVELISRRRFKSSSTTN